MTERKRERKAVKRAREQMERARGETLSGEAYRSRKSSTWRVGGRRAEGRFD